MNWIRVASIPLDKDLLLLIGYLQQRGVRLRVTEEQGEQVLWIVDAELLASVRELLERWLTGDLVLEAETLNDSESIAAASLSSSFSALLICRQSPMTLLLLMLSIAGALLIAFDKTMHWVHWFTLQDFVLKGEYIGFFSLQGSLLEGQWWRLVTPIFLHLSFFHILFNSLWLWEMGRRIEALWGPWKLLLFVLVSGALSNLLQYYWEGPGLVGGMSGVLYAFIGFIWLRQRWRPSPILAMPSGLIIMMLVWLVLCMTGAVDLFIDGSVANGAHLGGLLVGMLLGWWTSYWPRQA